jgi:hypothetical protein
MRITTMRSAFVVVLLLLLAVGRADADGPRTPLWLQYYEAADTRYILETWAAGVAQTLEVVVSQNGCEPPAVSGRTLAAATRDLLRENKDRVPMGAAIIAYQRLSGCSDTMPVLFK